MFLSSVLSMSDTRVRITPSLEKAVCQFAGTDKFSKALPIIEQAVKVYDSIRKEIAQGSVFYEEDENGQQFIAAFNLDPFSFKEPSSVRVRITKDLEQEIINLVGQENEEDKEKAFRVAQPYLNAAIHFSILLKGELDKGSKYFLKDSNGELAKVRFI